MPTPSLLNSLTHALITSITSSGAGFGGWRTISALQPRVLSTQLAPLSRLVQRGVQPHVSEALREAIRRRLQRGLDALPILHFCAVDSRLEHQSPRANQ